MRRKSAYKLEWQYKTLCLSKCIYHVYFLQIPQFSVIIISVIWKTLHRQKSNFTYKRVQRVISKPELQVD